MDERRMDTRTQRVRVTKGARSNGPTEYTARVLSARKRALTPRFRDNNLPAFVAPVELFALSPPPCPIFPSPHCLVSARRIVLYTVYSRAYCRAGATYAMIHDYFVYRWTRPPTINLLSSFAPPSPALPPLFPSISCRRSRRRVRIKPVEPRHENGDAIAFVRIASPARRGRSSAGCAARSFAIVRIAGRPWLPPIVGKLLIAYGYALGCGAQQASLATKRGDGGGGGGRGCD